MQVEQLKVIQDMFEKGAEYWKERNEPLKSGIVIPLHKKGDKEKPDNYGGMCLLSMGSRVLVRVIATRLREWAEEAGVLDDNQNALEKEDPKRPASR